MKARKKKKLGVFDAGVRIARDDSSLLEVHSNSEGMTTYFRIGEYKLRRRINENKNADYLLWNGNRIQIKREK